MTDQTNDVPVPVPGVMDVPDYFQGASSAPGIDQPIKLSSNENVYGSSPRVADAICDAATEVHHYPEGTAQALSHAIAAVHDIDPARVLTSTGSDDLIPTLMRAFLQRGDEGHFFADAFPKYRTNLIGIGANPVQMPRDKDRDYALCLESVSRQLTARSKLLIVDNPCNPTGAVFDADALSRLHAALPGNVVLAIDEAYVEFSDIGDAALRLAQGHQNIVVFRTFSKAFSLAGLRIGWCTGAPPLLAAMQRLRPTFPLTNLSIAAAIAALDDRPHMEKSVAMIRQTRSRVVNALRAAGWNIQQPHGNFLMLRGALSAPLTIKAAQSLLLSMGILVRPLTIQGGEPVLRITIGTDAHMQCVIQTLCPHG